MNSWEGLFSDLVIPGHMLIKMVWLVRLLHKEWHVTIIINFGGPLYQYNTASYWPA